jgi:class 3 adenylate cyclase
MTHTEMSASGDDHAASDRPARMAPPRCVRVTPVIVDRDGDDPPRPPTVAYRVSTDEAPNPQLGTRSSLPAGDRRTVTVLFVDLVGFTAM